MNGLLRTTALLLALSGPGCAPATRDDTGADEIIDAGPREAGEVDAGAREADAGLALDAGALDAGMPDAGGRLTLAVLTYNVAGLPQGLSSGNPTVNTPLISARLDAWDLVLVQEDFSHHAALAASATHAFQTTPMPATSTDLGDGLNVFSRYPLGPVRRVKWAACNGVFTDKNDCLTSKGFLHTSVTLAPGVVVDVYDLHADAGRSAGDAAARQQQMDQLVAYIAANSVGRALIVAGDTNMKASDEAQVQTLLAGAGLTDGCRALGCLESDRVDRVLYRSSATVDLRGTRSAVELNFVDGQGAQLSDHEPVTLELSLSER